MMMAFCNGFGYVFFVFKMLLLGFELSPSSSQGKLSSKGFETCERYAHLLKNGMIIF